MKQSEQFQQTIQTHLEQRAKEDALFAVSFAKASKNIKDCCTYILNTVKESGCSGFADDEIFSMAIHYYDEDIIKVGKPIKCKVVVNHTVASTKKAKTTPKKIKRATPDVQQLSLF